MIRLNTAQSKMQPLAASQTRTRLLLSLVALVTLAPLAPLAPFAHAANPTTQPTITWQPWSDDVFARAKAENKFVLMDLQAVWCHWCHVMDESTYRDPRVIALINQRYIAVKVDQDSRPDIANRYEDYGWPATVVFNATGNEIVKRRGYIEPDPMASMLQAIIDDPTPGPSVQPDTDIRAASNAGLTKDQRDQLADNIKRLYDDQNAGWAGATKFVDADVLEYCARLAAHGDARADTMARQTLTANLKLLDPAWGGVYQYSTDGDWLHPHFEKIMSYQADDLRTYARAYSIYHTPTPGSERTRDDPDSSANSANQSGSSEYPSTSLRTGLRTRRGEDEPTSYLHAAQSIHRYLTTFLLNPDGAFYTSQDADLHPGEHSTAYFALDDPQRRALGVPRIDTHIYSRENGWAIAALVAYANTTGDADALSQATRAANWIIAHRSLEAGGFSHNEHDAAGPYLGDTLAMGRAFLALHAATADRDWLDRAESAARFIATHFAHSNSLGVVTAAQHGPLRPRPQLDENVAVARFARLLYAYTAREEHQQLADRAMRYLASPDIINTRHWLVGGILLADQEMNGEPLHVTIVGKKNDALARDLYATARATPRSYLRLEWYDPSEGPLPRMDVQYPKLPTAAAFICTGTRCSSPAKDVQSLRQKLTSAP